MSGNMMNVLIVLYEGFTEYEYQIPILAFHHFGIPFNTVGLDDPVFTGMIGLKASLAKTLAEVDTENYTALFLPGLDSSKREHVMQNERLMVLLREFDQAKKIIAAVRGAPTLLGKAGILKGRQLWPADAFSTNHSTLWTLPAMSRPGFCRRNLHWMLGFGLAPRLQLASMQERSTQTALLPRFSLASVGLLDIQFIQMSLHESDFDLVVRLKFQIPGYIS